ncbi:MAG: hypothetical protein QXM76_01430 [Zestosphaera sp.]
MDFEEVKRKLLRAFKDEGVEPPSWIDYMVVVVVDAIERYGGNVDYEVRRAVWALKEIRSDIETLEAEQQELEKEMQSDEESLEAEELEYDEEDECMDACFEVCHNDECFEDCIAGCI